MALGLRLLLCLSFSRSTIRQRTASMKTPSSRCTTIRASIFLASRLTTDLFTIGPSARAPDASIRCTILDMASSANRSLTQGAVRRLGEVAYHRILAAADVVSTSLDTLPSTETVSPFYLAGTPTAPRDAFRTIVDIPPGAGYVPRDTIVDVNESAALQERARADHQAILQRISVLVHATGGTCSYNNNVDLLTEHGNRRTLIEAKSLTDLRDAVDRMRYGIGQLADYAHRYRAELQGAQSTLAFGKPPDRQTGWIADVLQANAIAFVALDGNAVIPMNEAARTLPFLTP
jgi:hypothetical protein